MAVPVPVSVAVPDVSTVCPEPAVAQTKASPSPSNTAANFRCMVLIPNAARSQPKWAGFVIRPGRFTKPSHKMRTVRRSHTARIHFLTAQPLSPIITIGPRKGTSRDFPPLVGQVFQTADSLSPRSQERASGHLRCQVQVRVMSARAASRGRDKM